MVTNIFYGDFVISWAVDYQRPFLHSIAAGKAGLQDLCRNSDLAIWSG
jgi:hypothetical protein